MTSHLRVLLVGLGSIGRRHLANLLQLEPSAVVVIWRIQGGTADGNVEGCRVVRTLEAALDARPQVALVTCPASLHVEVATALARSGVHLFIEKPLADSARAAAPLVDLCRSAGLTLAVGYNLRFYPPMQVMREAVLSGRIGRLLSLRAEVGQHLTDWRPGTDYRQSVSARRDLGGGAVLELSHEIDYVRWIAGEVREVTARIAKVSDLEVDVEDTAEVICQFEGGALGSLHLDMVQRPARRTCRVVGTKGVLVWDRSTHEVRFIRADGGADEILHPAAEVSLNQMYLDELRHFLAAARGGPPPLVTGEDALRTLVVADAIKQSSSENRTVEL